MRTLSRPMFNWGGPVKAGIMHGIREPYKGGGKAALVGNPVYPKTGGREHHYTWIPAAAQGIARVAPRALPHIKRAGSAFKNIFRGGAPNVTGSMSGRARDLYKYRMAPLSNLEKVKSWFSTAPAGKYLAASPEGRLISGAPGKIGWAGRKLWGGAKGLASSPLTVGGTAAWYFWPDGTKRQVPPPTPGTGVPGGGDPGMTYTAEKSEPSVKSQKELDAFALAQRNKRVQKYLDMMGYDRSKKTALADALIDASKIVSDRGTLDRKNITAELINPIIQATSKRLDKPDQIREAVGLMATKAEIEKDLSKEKDALKTELTQLQIEGAKKELKASRSFEGGLKAFLATRKGGIKKDELEQISRLLADEHGETFIKTDEDTVVSGDGIYMIGDGIYRVTDGVEKQIA